MVFVLFTVIKSRWMIDDLRWLLDCNSKGKMPPNVTCPKRSSDSPEDFLPISTNMER